MGDGSGTSDGGSRNFPPVGAPDRYDMIVQRGRVLRRRRRYTLGAGAGGTVVALAVAVVLVTNGGPEDPTVTELADDATTTTEAIVTAGEGTTTTTSMPDVMTVTIDEATSTVLVQDPAQPVHDAAKQCVYLQLTDPAGNFVAEGSGCNTGTGPIEVRLNPPGVEIIDACSMERDEPTDPAELAALPTGAASSSFVYRIDPEIPDGEYQLTGTAVSGLTDGCADTNDTTFERENVAKGEITIELP